MSIPNIIQNINNLIKGESIALNLKNDWEKEKIRLSDILKELVDEINQSTTNKIIEFCDLEYSIRINFKNYEFTYRNKPHTQIGIIFFISLQSDGDVSIGYTRPFIIVKKESLTNEYINNIITKDMTIVLESYSTGAEINKDDIIKHLSKAIQEGKDNIYFKKHIPSNTLKQTTYKIEEESFSAPEDKAPKYGN